MSAPISCKSDLPSRAPPIEAAASGAFCSVVAELMQPDEIAAEVADKLDAIARALGITT